MTTVVAPRERPIEDIRADFPALAEGLAMLDGAAGTQVPQAVIDAVAAGLRGAMSNLAGHFPASARSTATVAAARAAAADYDDEADIDRLLEAVAAP